jgi:AraC-like DNA-binding protein
MPTPTRPSPDWSERGVPTRVAAVVAPCLVVYAPRERAREFARTAFPRRRCRVIVVRGAEEFAAAMRTELVDGALVDIAGPGDDTWRVAALAREFPSAPFFGIAPLRAVDGPGLAQCAALEFADLLVEGVDDDSARALLAPRFFSTRFAAALVAPPPSLGLDTPLQQEAWRAIVAHAGRAVRTSTLATALGVTREHLSRAFAARGAPNLKRVIDLVRLVAAAELAKNPGHDVRDIARILGFASSSHLSSTAQRIVGTKSVSLARLRTVDLVERFAKGRGRSRG